MWKEIEKICLTCCKKFKTRQNGIFCSGKCFNSNENVRAKRSLRMKTNNPFKYVMRRNGWKHSIEARMKISVSRLREKNCNWKGGISLLNNQLRHSFEYRQWRNDVFTRDNFTCQWCSDDRGGNLNADHIKPLSLLLQFYEITNFEQALICEEIWNINNGRTLCIECHKKTDTYGWKLWNKKESAIVVRNK